MRGGARSGFDHLGTHIAAQKHCELVEQLGGRGSCRQRGRGWGHVAVPDRLDGGVLQRGADGGAQRIVEQVERGHHDGGAWLGLR